MREIRCKNLVFGQGLPKICIPLVGANAERIKEECELAKQLPADLLEWRVDCWAGLALPMDLLRCCKGEYPLLVTVRTKDEGGSWQGTAEEYEKLITELLNSGICDLIDIELCWGEERVKRLLKKAKENGVLTVLSKHNFLFTPKTKEIENTFMEMASLGADLPKYALMPQSTGDVLKLLCAAVNVQQQAGPLIAVSMGEYGKITRVSGQFFASAVTFAAGAASSAPGQISCESARSIMQALQISTEEVQVK